MGVTEVEDETDAERVEELEGGGRVTIGGGRMFTSTSPSSAVAVDDPLRFEENVGSEDEWSSDGFEVNPKFCQRPVVKS